MSKTKVPAFVRRNLPFILFLVAAFAFRWSLADQYVVPSGSMEPTIEVGDHIVVNKMAYDLRLPYTSLVLSKIGDPQRADIIVFENPKSNVTMVKRIIGMPGDHMIIDDGFISINGEPIPGDAKAAEQLAAAANDGAFTYQETFPNKTVTIKRLPFMDQPRHFEMVVPDNEYFAMGDNRDNSADSRVWGFVPREKLKGRAFGIFWSMHFEDWIPHFNLQRTVQALN